MRLSMGFHCQKPGIANAPLDQFPNQAYGLSLAALARTPTVSSASTADPTVFSVLV